MPSLCVGAASSWRSVLATRNLCASRAASSGCKSRRVFSKVSHGDRPAAQVQSPATPFIDSIRFLRCPSGADHTSRTGLLRCTRSFEAQAGERFSYRELQDQLVRAGPFIKEFKGRGGALSERRYTTAMPTDAQIKAEALSIIRQSEKLPLLVVFDLDYTIWPFWCEVKTTRSQPRLYPEIRGIFEALAEARVPMAVASRTPSPNIATVFLKKLQLSPIFVQQEIYPTFTHKTEHFKALLQGTNVPYEDMLFFDDEDRNVDTISPLGVKCVLVEDGVNLNALKEGFAKFQLSRSKVVGS